MTEREFLTRSVYGRYPAAAFPALADFLRAQGFHDASRAVENLHDRTCRDTMPNPVLLAEMAALKEPHGPKVPCVYFIQRQSGPIKIGFTKNLKQRLSALRTSSAEPLTLLGHIPGGKEIEAELHARLSAHRLKGEWFNAASEVIAEIERRRA